MDRPSDAHAEESATPPSGDAETLATPVSDHGATPAASAPSSGAPAGERAPGFASVGPYRIIHEVGRGGMGVVYLAVKEDDKFKRRVALKLLKKGMDTDDVLRRFELERQLLASLNHPGIARLYDAGETDTGLPYIVMEYIEGSPIADYCDNNRLEINDRIALFQKVCSAVHHAHQNLVVHRDLKPSNIVVTADGQPKLLDFGIAKLLNPELALIAGDPTAPEVRVMTPEYASPEQVRGEPITTASDIYSLGVLLYELLSGHAPYKLRTRVREELERVICNQEPERPSTAISRVDEIDAATGTTSSVTPESVSRTRGGRPERLRRRLAGDIDNIVLMAMRKEPRRRYASAEALAGDLQRHRDGLPVSARPDTFNYRATKFVRRHRPAVAAAAFIAILLVGGIAGTTSGWRAADDQRDEAVDARDAEEAQRKIAEDERDRADRRFQQVRALARTFMFDFHDAIQTLDGSTPARELLVTTALEYLDALAAEVQDDVELQRELASAYERVGDIRGGVRNPSLGDVDGAMESYGAAMAIRLALVEADPENDVLRHDLSGTEIRVGDILFQTGTTDEALTHFRNALVIRERLAGRDLEDLERQRDVAVALLNVGAALMSGGDEPAALEQYERSQEIRRKLAAAAPDDLVARREVSVGCLRVGARMAALGREDDALAQYAEAAEIRTALVDAQPDSGRARRDLGVAKYFVGVQLIRMDRSDEALAPLTEYRSIAAKRVEDNPRSARAKRDLATAEQILGQAYAKQEKWTTAMEHFRRFQATIAPLAEAEPTNAQFVQLLAESHGHIGEVHAAGGDFDRAIENGRKAVAILRKLANADKSDARRQANLARMMLQLGTWLEQADQPGEAMQQLEAARGVYAVLAEGDSADVTVATGLADSLAELSRLMVRLGDGAAALEYARESIDAEPAPSPDRLRILARAQHVSGDDASAAATVRAALELLDEVETELGQELQADLREYEGGPRDP